MKTSTNYEYDAIVIGSGLGGLSTAALLSKLLKKRVLVLERHFEPGGLTHEFKRGPYSWDVGVHYVGDLTKRPLDIIGYLLFKYVTNGKLKWSKLPKIYDKFILPDLSFEVPRTLSAYKKALIKQFPKSKKEIKRYIKDVHNARIWYLSYFFANFLHAPFKNLFTLLMKIYNKYSTITTEEYLVKNISDPKLRAVLTIRWGNYGIPPYKSAFASHSITEHHYFPGAMFPVGGAEKMATYIEQTIEDNGGKILVNREVKEIIIENSSAKGVRVKNITNNSGEIIEYFAPIIISAAGAKNTYLKLLPDLDLTIQKSLKSFPDGYSALNLYIGFKSSPETLGIKGENIWINNSYDLDFFKSESDNILNNNPTSCFVSFPSLKSGTKSNHTADVVVIFPYDIFGKWKDKQWKERDNEYYQLKDKITENILNLIETKIPGFKDLIAYKELATPLTFEHFTNKNHGTFYGLPAIPERFKLDLKVQTPIKNLYLTGTDVICNGVLPALNSGMGTVSNIMGVFGIFKMMNKVFSFKTPKIKKEYCFNDDQCFSEDKLEGKLINKIENGYLTELLIQFENIPQLTGGQHIKMYVAPGEWRAYSIKNVKENVLTLMIDTRTKGHGATFTKNIKLNDIIVCRLPISDLVYHESNNHLFFIATGTGLVPFLHMLDELKKRNIKKDITVLFGCMSDLDNYAEHYINQYKSFFSIETHIYVEKPLNSSIFNQGRVSDFFNSTKFNKDLEYDFYVCGHPHMTESIVKQLRSSGMKRVYY